MESVRGRLVPVALVACLLLHSVRPSPAFAAQERASSFATPVEIAIFHPLQLAGGPVYGVRLNLLAAYNPSLAGLDIGLGVNQIGSEYEQDEAHGAAGVQAAGLANVVGGGMLGIQAAGLANFSWHSLRGVQVAGLANYAARVNGLQVAGLANLSGTLFDHVVDSREPGIAVQVAALMNTGHFTGIQAGAWNTNPGNALQFGLVNSVGNGMQFGLWNNAPDHKIYHGAQIGVVNVAQGGMAGLQVGALSGLGQPFGIFGGKYDSVVSRGVQVGLFCKSNDFHGLQVGLVNIANALRGVQLGLYNQANNAKFRILPLVNVAF